MAHLCEQWADGCPLFAQPLSIEILCSRLTHSRMSMCYINLESIMRAYQKHRPTTLDELQTARKSFLTEEGRVYGRAFQPRASDVIISPFAKSGTTWLQQITHGLRTGGSMDFSEITEVTPWIEVAYDLGWDLNADQVASPRVFKSHLNYYEIPKGGRYIYSIRTPEDVLVSYYRFYEGWLFEPYKVDITTFARDLFMLNPQEKSYWMHLISWWEQHDNENVLFLCYEDMIDDPITTIKTIARFMGIELNAELLELVNRQSTRAFMLAHHSQFDDHLVRRHIERRSGISANGGSSKVTNGKTDSVHYQLSPMVQGELNLIWHTMINERFGFKDYAAFRLALRQHNTLRERSSHMHSFEE